MKPIKQRWHMWKHYTSNIDKTVHCIILAVFPVLATALLINFSWVSILGIAGYACIAYVFIMKDVWGNAYQKTEALRRLGAHTAEALHTYTFVKMANVRGAFSIEPDLPAIDPDAPEDDIYTDEIVIRRGMSIDGDPLIAWSIPEDLQTETVLGMLEHTKLQYSYDILADPHD